MATLRGNETIFVAAQINTLKRPDKPYVAKRGRILARKAISTRGRDFADSNSRLLLEFLKK